MQDIKIEVARPDGVHYDWKYRINNGEWSEMGYVSRNAAHNAAWRKIEREEKKNTQK
jgi:hypothetical protein